MTTVPNPPPWTRTGEQQSVWSRGAATDGQTAPEMLVEVSWFARQGVRRNEMQDAVLVGPTIVSMPTESPVQMTFRRPERPGSPTTASPVAVAVLDGVGGVVGGHEASAISALILGDLIAGGPARDLGEIVRDVDTRVCDLAGRLGERSTMASTVAGIRIRPGGYEVFNAGDSRVHALRDGYLVQYSTDHERNGRLTQYLGGARRNVEPFVGGFRPAGDGDLVLLCTDGFSRHVPTDDVQRAVTGASAIEQLWGLAEGAHDDASVVLVRWCAATRPADEARTPDGPQAKVDTGAIHGPVVDPSRSTPTVSTWPVAEPSPPDGDGTTDPVEGMESGAADGSSDGPTDGRLSRVRRWLRR